MSLQKIREKMTTTDENLWNNAEVAGLFVPVKENMNGQIIQKTFIGIQVQ